MENCMIEQKVCFGEPSNRLEFTHCLLLAWGRGSAVNRSPGEYDDRYAVDITMP